MTDATREGRWANVSAALLLEPDALARAPFEGRSLASALAERLGALFCEVLLVGGAPPEDAPGRAVAAGDHALRAALEHATAERVLVLGVDRPFTPGEVMLALLAWPEADAVFPRAPDAGDCALYRREPTLAALRRAPDDPLPHLVCSVLEPEDLRSVDPAGNSARVAESVDDLSLEA